MVARGSVGEWVMGAKRFAAVGLTFGSAAWCTHVGPLACSNKHHAPRTTHHREGPGRPGAMAV